MLNLVFSLTHVEYFKDTFGHTSMPVFPVDKKPPCFFPARTNSLQIWPYVINPISFSVLTLTKCCKDYNDVQNFIKLISFLKDLCHALL